MTTASYAQTSFLGGEISQWAQGQYDDPLYKKSASSLSNTIVVDEGAATRRPGFKRLGTTRLGKAGRLIPFDFAEDSPYNMEFTDGYLRFWNGNSLVDTNDSHMIQTIEGSGTATFVIAKAVTWQTGDLAYFSFGNPAQAVAGNVLLNREFVLTMLSSTTFTLADAITGEVITSSTFTEQTLAVLGAGISSSSISTTSFSGSALSSINIYNISATVHHVAAIPTEYFQATDDWHSLRAVQGLTSSGKSLSVLLHTSVAPQALEVLVPPTVSAFAAFEYSQAVFEDGPYLDQPNNAIATASAVSGNIQVVVGYPAWVSTTVYGLGVPVTYSGQDYVSLVNNNKATTPSSSPASWQSIPLGSMIGTSGFVATDVGRMIRLFSAPAVWDPTVTYAAGNTVAYGGVVAQGSASYFTSLISSNMNNQPDISTTDWVLNTTAAIYTWGVITSVLNANTVQVQLNGSNLLYTTPCPAFQIGAWSETTGFPTAGCYQGGRFWYAGAIPNRVDSSQSNDPFNMAPTLPDGTVTDNCGITYTFNSNSVDEILSMEPQPTGILVFSAKGEYLLSSGTGNGPITPSSIAESPATKYGSSDILPVKTGLSLCFVQKYGRRVLEYLADVFSARFYGPDLTTRVRHIGQKQFMELAYQQEPAPLVWARMGDGSIAATTYRRVSLFSNQPPEFNAWHQHSLGSERLVESICVGPSTGTENILDTLAMVTNDPATNIRYIEALTPLLDETDPLTLSWFLDSAVVPPAASLANNAITFYGLSYLNGKKVSVFAAAIDCGDYIVTNGQVTVPLGTMDTITGNSFDTNHFNVLQPLASEFSDLSVMVVNGGLTFSIPCVIGFNYLSQGQMCRPQLPIDTGAKNGPGFGKLRRTSKYAINLVASLGVKVGMNFTDMLTVNYATPKGNLPPYLSTYTGIIREPLNDDFTYDSMLCWSTTRPYPATVVTFGGFIETQDI